jgi:hypothetical protein
MDLLLLNAVPGSAIKLDEERLYGTVIEREKPLNVYGIIEDNHTNAVPVVDT